MIAPSEHAVVINGLRLHYLEWGNGNAPALVLLHGTRSSADTWRRVAAALEDHWHVIALDQRGRGDSAWDPDADYSVRAYVGDLEQFVDEMRLATFYLLGHSSGGMVTMVYAARHPERVRAAIIEDIGPSTIGTGASERIVRELQTSPVSFASWAEAEAFQRQRMPALSSERVHSGLRYMFRELPDGTVTWRYDLAGLVRGREKRRARQGRVEYWAELRAIQCPTLVLRGERSDSLSADTAAAMAESNPMVRVVEVANAGHNAHVDNRPDFLRALARFLEPQLPTIRFMDEDQ